MLLVVEDVDEVVVDSSVVEVLDVVTVVVELEVVVGSRLVDVEEDDVVVADCVLELLVVLDDVVVVDSVLARRSRDGDCRSTSRSPGSSWSMPHAGRDATTQDASVHAATMPLTAPAAGISPLVGSSTPSLQ